MLNKSVVSMLVIVLCYGAIAAFAGDDVAKVSASGKAEKSVKADTAWIIIYLSADGILMTDAEKAYQEKFAKLESVLKEKFKDIQSIEQKTIAIGQKRSNYVPDQNKPQPEIRKQIIVVLPPDTKLASDIIDTAIRNGAMLTADNQSYYSGQLNSVVIYGLKESTEAEKEVQKLAFADFKKNAETIAALIAYSHLGNVSTISVSGTTTGGQQIYIPGMNMPLPFKYYALEPDKIKVSAAVSGTFEIFYNK